MIITIQHVRAAGYCLDGVRMFLKNRGFVWRDVVRNGIEEEQLLKIDDIMVKKIIKFARISDGS